MQPQFVTEGAASWASQVWATESFWASTLTRGRSALRRAGIETRSDDLALLAYLAWRGMSALKREGELEDDYLVAGDVLDEWVTDRDAEILCEAIPLPIPEPVGGMTAEVTAVHDVLLSVTGYLRDTWTSDDDLASQYDRGER